LYFYRINFTRSLTLYPSMLTSCETDTGGEGAGGRAGGAGEYTDLGEGEGDTSALPWLGGLKDWLSTF
jgi:hypothetical protein